MKIEYTFVLYSSARGLRLNCVGMFLSAVILCSGLAERNVEAANQVGGQEELYEICAVEGALQENSVTAIIQSLDGYLWLGTYHGLVRFDGASFAVFDSSTTPALHDGRITSLHTSADGTLWIGHETGHITRLLAGGFYDVDPGTNWTSGAVEAITSDEQGDIWLLNDAGLLLRVRDGRTAMVPGGAGPLHKATLARSKDGRIWLTANGTLARLDGGKIVTVLPAGGQPVAYHEKVFPADDGGIWVIGGGKLRKWREGAWVAEIAGFPSELGTVHVVVETPHGLLAGTIRDGLYLFPPGARPLHYTRREGLSHNWVRLLFVDREKNCWLGTGTGFDRLRRRKVRMVIAPDTWEGCSVLSFSLSPDGTVWAGTEGAGLYRYAGGQWTVFKQDSGLSNPFVWAVLETREQELFVGTWGGGLFRRTGERFERTGELSQISAPVTALYQGRHGELWIGTGEGLYSFENDKLTCRANKSGLVLPDVRAITESEDGTLWFGMSGGGLGTWKNGSIHQFRKSDGLSSDLVSCLYADESTLWIGTLDNGLTRYQQGRFSTITTENGLPGKIITHVVDDGAGYLWLGTQNGILRVRKADLHRCADRETACIACLTYGRADGLTAQVCSSAFQPGACKSRDGRLWFPTTKGLAVVDPAVVTSNSVAPPVVIEAMHVDGIPTGRQELSGNRAGENASPYSHLAAEIRNQPLQIGPGHRRFEIRYTGLSFVAPEKVKFRCKLEGLEQNWVDMGARRIREYNYLPPQAYIFKVIACNNDGIWNEAGAALAFVVQPFLWETVWFRAGSAAAGVLGVVMTVLWMARRRLHRKLQNMERQRAFERERARIARDIHDELGASLTRVSLLTEVTRGEVADRPQAAGHLDQIHSTARELIRSIDEIVWAVNPQHDTLDSLVAYLGRYAERYLDVAGIRCRLDVPVHLPPWEVSAELRHNVFLVFKEALHNVMKHAQASEVRVAVELTPHRFELLIADNGRGFNAAEGTGPVDSIRPMAPPDALRSAPGNGLLNMRKRMEEVGGTCTWNSAPGEGTRIKIVVITKS